MIKITLDSLFFFCLGRCLHSFDSIRALCTSMSWVCWCSTLFSSFVRLYDSFSYFISFQCGFVALIDVCIIPSIWMFLDLPFFSSTYVECTTLTHTHMYARTHINTFFIAAKCSIALGYSKNAKHISQFFGVLWHWFCAVMMVFLLPGLSIYRLRAM